MPQERIYVAGSWGWGTLIGVVEAGEDGRGRELFRGGRARSRKGGGFYDLSYRSDCREGADSRIQVILTLTMANSESRTHSTTADRSRAYNSIL